MSLYKNIGKFNLFWKKIWNQLTNLFCCCNIRLLFCCLCESPKKMFFSMRTFKWNFFYRWCGGKTTQLHYIKRNCSQLTKAASICKTTLVTCHQHATPTSANFPYNLLSLYLNSSLDFIDKLKIVHKWYFLFSIMLIISSITATLRK